MVDPPMACGAGHRCCGVVDGPPLHGHFLDPETCPRCWDLARLDGDAEGE